MARSTTGADAAHPLYILAMDHRDSLAKQVYKITDEPSAEQAAAIAADKMLVFEGAEAARQQLPTEGEPGILVDERYGAAVARAAREHGFTLIMPIERSGRPFFELEFGDFGSSEWLDHVDEFDPDFVKVLVRDNPEFGADDRRLQQEHLAQVIGALHEAGRRLIVELLVPATGSQDAAGAENYDRSVRPSLTAQLIRDFHQAGVEPDIWKLEGYETAEAAASVSATAREGQRDSVRCIVLGRDAAEDRLDHWLRTAAPVDGFAGFAIGRSIWEQPLIDQLAGRIDADGLRHRVAESFRQYADVYSAAAHRPT
ncbi:2-deoxy-5-keto-D-gluconate 6-phosphate aldolase domain-containing protein [Leifsonia sp. 2MCAF36]|uniref:2-deoxy-5-keto-D-gluconate 6-phosphate aldolase domain-containing protein n=1 Tax=Leifsonia sp. 2MCAF36 TaxID=3232988 RepID=UPI003F967163